MTNRTNIKLVENNVPQELTVKVSHLHSGNSSRRQRRGSKYMTIAKLVGPTGDVVAEGFAQCRSTDAPSRQVGRQVAIGRAYKEYLTEVADTLEVG